MLWLHKIKINYDTLELGSDVESGRAARDRIV